MRRAAASLAAIVLAALAAAAAVNSSAAGAELATPARAIDPQALRSGVAFAGASVREMQADDLANPGMLWVERGEALWRTGTPESPACAACHADASVSMHGVAARYPAYDERSGRVLDLEGRINACRVDHQKQPPLAREADDLLAVSTFVAHQSRGLPIHVTIDERARDVFERGRAFYYERHGQMNLSCANCHEENWGRRLLVETVSQGHPSAFPAYRLEWQTLGSINRRLRACLNGIRAEMLPPDAPEYVALELFLAWRAQGLPVETPGVRR